MTTERDVYEIDTSAAVDGLDKAHHSAGALQEAMKELGHEIKDNLTQSFVTAEAQFEILKEAYHEIIDTIKEGIKEWQAQAEAVARQTVILRNHGEESEKYAESLAAQREQIEKNLGVDQAYTANLQNVILTMGVAASEVQRFTEDSINLAKVMNQDAVTAARLLARAHAEGKEELKKYGITIKETADLGGGFASVLTEVEARTKGINEAMPEYTRLINQQGAVWSEAKKKIGEWGAELWTWLNRDTLKASELQDQVRKVTLDARNSELKSILEQHGLGEKPVPTMQLDPIGVEIQTPEFKARVKADRAERVKEMAEFVKSLYDAQRKAVKGAGDESVQAQKAFFKQMQKEAKDDADIENATLEEMTKEDKALREEQKKNAEELHKKEVEEQKKAAEEVKQIKQQMLADFKSYAHQILGAIAGIVGDTLTANTQFNQKMREFQIQREMATAKELGQNKSRVEIEKQLQQEEKAANAQRIADTLKAIAEQAAVKAIFEGVAAIASAADYDEGAAYQHLAAAAGFAAVALAAGGAASTISNSRGLTTSERTQLEDAEKTKKETAAREDKQAGQVAKGAASIVNVYYLGITGKTTAEQGRELDAIYKEYDMLKTGA